VLAGGVTTVLLTLGRLPKALELARSLHAAGCRVIVAEPFHWHVCRLSRAVARSYRTVSPNRDLRRYQGELIDVIIREQVDLVVPISEEVVHVLPIEARLPDGVRIFSPPASTLVALHDKLSFARMASDFALEVPTTYALEDPRARELALAGQYVVKPAHGCSGIGMQIRARGTPLPAPGHHGRHVVQRFVNGDQVSTFSIAYQGVTRTTVIYRGKVYSRTVAVCFERVPELACVTDWIERFVARAGISGFISFDFIIEGGRAQAIECNPRLTSGVHFLASDYLAAAVLAPDQTPPVSFRDQQLLQQFYTMLTRLCANLTRPRQFQRCLANLLRARDVVWTWRDPLPFLLMGPACSEILAAMLFEGRSFSEAVMRDIAWFDEATPGGTPGDENTGPEPVRRGAHE
jgi:hypothetical protein